MNQLSELAALIDSRADWWRFPQEEVVQGFMGTGRLFIVGDQPSTSQWEFSHPNRRALYDLLERVSAADAHLYKRRGRSGSLRNAMPQDFGEHVELFRKELALLKPTRVVALGHLAHRLLSRYVPEVRPILGRIWHVAYATRYNKLSAYRSNMERAFNPGSQHQNATQWSNSEVASTQVGNGCEGDVVRTSTMCVAVQGAPLGAAIRRWTLRDDNNSHHHGIVRLSESPLYLHLSWRATSSQPAQEVGTFQLDLFALLRAGYIRSESVNSGGTDVRLRIVRTRVGLFFIQAHQDGPHIPLGEG